MTNPKTIRSRIHSEITQPTRRDLATATLNDRNALWHKTDVVTEILDTKYQGIFTNRSLSSAGQQTAIGNLATEFIPEFAFLERVVAGLDKELANTTLFTVKPVITDPVLRHLRNSELREGLYGLSSNQRDAKFFQAAEQGQDEVLDAMLDAPGGMLVGPDTKRRALDARAARRHPEAFAQWKQDTLYRELVNGLRDHCALCLVSMGADPKKVEQVLGAASNQVESAA